MDETKDGEWGQGSPRWPSTSDELGLYRTPHPLPLLLWMFQHMESRTKKELLKGAVQSSVSNLLCYDRKNDEELTDEDVRKLLDSGDVTIEEMVKWFYDELWDQTD